MAPTPDNNCDRSNNLKYCNGSHSLGHGQSNKAGPVAEASESAPDGPHDTSCITGVEGDEQVVQPGDNNHTNTPGSADAADAGAAPASMRVQILVQIDCHWLYDA